MGKLHSGFNFEKGTPVKNTPHRLTTVGTRYQFHALAVTALQFCTCMFSVLLCNTEHCLTLT